MPVQELGIWQVRRVPRQQDPLAVELVVGATVLIVLAQRAADREAMIGPDRLVSEIEEPVQAEPPSLRPYDARRSTREIDAVCEPKRAVYEAAAVLAEQRDLPIGWLNDAVKGFLAGPDPQAAPVLERPGLRVLAASPRTLLALKVVAHRVGEDEGDVLLLADALGLSDASDVLAVAEEVFGDRLEPAARFFVEELFAGRG